MKTINKITILFCAFCFGVPYAMMAQQTIALSLEDCRQKALANSQEMQKTTNKLQSAQEDKKIAFNAYLPKLDGSFTGLYSKDQDIMGSTLLLKGVYMAGLNITQPLYAGGQITAANNLAAIGEECAKQMQNKTRMQTISYVDNAYYTLIAVREKVKMLEVYVQRMDSLYSQVNRSVSVSMATDNDLLRISSKQSELQYQLNKARNGQSLCQMSLCNLIGECLQDSIALTDTTIDIQYPSSLDEDISLSPDINLLQQGVKAQEQQVKREKSNYLPQAGLALGYTFYGNIKMEGYSQAADGNYYPYSQSYHGTMPLAMLSVKIPLWHWGSEFRKVKKAKLELSNAELDLQKNKNLISIQMRSAVQNLKDGYTLIQTATLALKQAEENLRVMKEKYDNSMCTMTDILDAQSQWQLSCSNLIEAKTQYKIYQTQYKCIRGIL